MKYSVVVNMDQENKTTLRNMDFTKTTHLFIKNKKNGIKNCDFLKIAKDDIICTKDCGVGEVGGPFNPQIFSNIWKILSSQSNLKSIFFLSKIQNNILMIFFSLPGLVAYQYQYQYQYEYAPLKEVMPYIYYQIIPKHFVI